MYKAYTPQTLNDFIGEKNIVEDLKINISAARLGGRAVEHLLMSGSAGLGKTTLARIIANEMGSKLYEFPAASVKAINQLDYMIYQLKKFDILFIDEIHNLKASIAENMYTLMESGTYNRVCVPPFTLIGATNYAGNIDKPLRDRMVHKYTFKEYSTEDLALILTYNGAPTDVAVQIALRSRGVPRIARNYWIKVSNNAQSKGIDVSVDACTEVFNRLIVDEIGLNEEDVNVLNYLRENGAFEVRRAIGEKAICTALSIEEVDYRTIVEPHLMRLGLVGRTVRGRVLTSTGIDYINKKMLDN